MNHHLTTLPAPGGEYTDWVTDPATIGEKYADFLGDESKLRALSLSEIALPSTVEELVLALRSASLRGRRITISGGRTGIVGGAVPDPSHSVISTSKLKSIGPIKRTKHGAEISVGGGVLLFELHDELQNRGEPFSFPVDPTETWASIGGMISTNASGARSYGYGATRQWVLALDLVLVSGDRITLRRGEVKVSAEGKLTLERGGQRIEVFLADIPKPPLKNTVGYTYYAGMDAVDLFIGSEGTLAVVAGATLQLISTPEARLSYLQFFHSADDALSFVEWLRKEKPMELIAIEFLDDRAMELARSNPSTKDNPAAQISNADHRAAVYIEAIGESGEELRSGMAPVLDTVSELGACATESVTEVGRFQIQSMEQLTEGLEQIMTKVEQFGTSVEESFAGLDERYARELRMFRHAVPERINSIIAERKALLPKLHKVATDMAVTDEHLREVYELYIRKLSASKIDFAIFGHIGNNHLHVNMLPASFEELEEAKRLYQFFAEEVVKMGGVVSAEHGLGKLKRHMLEIQYNDQQIAEMRLLKQLFDPNYQLNPGVLFSVPEAEESEFR